MHKFLRVDDDAPFAIGRTGATGRTEDVDSVERNGIHSVGPITYGDDREGRRPCTREFAMSRAEQYRNLAAEVRARASREESPIIKAEWENLAWTYVRLAEQSERLEGHETLGPTYDPIADLLDRSRR